MHDEFESSGEASFRPRDWRLRSYVTSVGFELSTRRGIFRRSGDEEDLFQCLGLQRNKYVGEPTFTVNLGLADLAAQARAGFEAADVSRLGPDGCLVQARLGEFVPPSAEDRWWELTDTDVTTAIDALKRWGMPALEHLRTRQSLADNASGPLSPRLIHRAILYDLLGDRASAERLAQAAIEHSLGSGSKEGVRKMAEQILPGA